MTMRRTYTLFVALAVACAGSAQTTHELTNMGIVFSPDLITMQPGDSIHLVLSAPHTCTQVSEDTWNANGNTPNGGFNFLAGDTTFALDDPGTYFYVCVVHAGMGMKGRIIVDSGTGILETGNAAAFELMPNPAQDHLQVKGLLPGQRVRVLNVAGATVLEATPDAGGMLDISSLKPGNYQVQVCEQKGSVVGTKRLVIGR
jgi:plastocyanin